MPKYSTTYHLIKKKHRLIFTIHIVLRKHTCVIEVSY